MADMKSVEGGCHCGVVRFKADVDLSQTMECNCSHCSKKGFVLTFTPADHFKVTSGEDNLTEYRFNKKQIAHLFCSTCGVQAFGRGAMPDGTKTAAINVRCIDDIDLAALKPQQVDGKSF
ncbi:GFA family protein [Hyphococcus sp.]|uniref:GFA family protein n=1 Tax=Hyphococcus sp. TaxID=2038636 RepID=UPI0035C76805